jgi:multimeric flavodoxin WrbA
MGYITGIMKTFFDRWYAYGRVPDEKKLPPGKKVVLVMPYRRPEEDLFNHVAKQVGQAFKFVFGVKVESLMVPGVGPAGEVLQREEYMQKAYNIGLGLASDST